VVNVKDQKVKGQGHKVTHKKFTQSRALALVMLESKRPLIVVVAQKKLYSESANLGRGFQNVIVFDRLLTGHVIRRRMRSGRVHILNDNQRETL